MIHVDLFSDDERQYINSIVKGRRPDRITRKEILDIVAFARDIADNTDYMILDLIDGVYSKIFALTDEEWEQLRAYLPFLVNITSDDNDKIPEE